MLRVMDLRGASWPLGGPSKSAIPRSAVDVDSVLAATKEIIAQVKSGGVEAVLDLTEKFDQIRPKSLRVPQEVITAAVEQLDSEFRTALLQAAARVRLVSEQQVRTDVITNVSKTGKVTNRWIPIDRVGLYVPGGRAAYPSSVIMNVVPAQVAGVQSMMIMSPPSVANNGWPHQAILGAAGLLGVTEIYAVGGAQAIAMAAHGIGCDPVDLVTGPGNIYVTAAKRALNGLIGIDSEAGPTEVAIIADDSADAAFVAADLISQAEHDVVAAAVLISTSENLVQQVQLELKKQVTLAKHKSRIESALSGIQSVAILVDQMSQAVQVANSYAAEHLEIQTTNSNLVADQIRNAGAVFIGGYSPVSLGDYLAGSNHVLPTAGCACHSAGLSVETFLKLVSLIEYDKTALDEVAAMIQVLALKEDLPSHWDAVAKRFTGGTGD
jgi:histidinol dehydrogenase